MCTVTVFDDRFDQWLRQLKRSLNQQIEEIVQLRVISRRVGFFDQIVGFGDDLIGSNFRVVLPNNVIDPIF